MSVPSPAALATVMAYEEVPGNLPKGLGASRYARLERHGTVVVADAGRAPPLEYGAEAQAGCLSFEMSSGSRLVFVNGGMPGAADADWLAAARSTASHNTLCLGERSAGRLIRHAGLEEQLGAAPLRGPPTVKAELKVQDGAPMLSMSHDGYLARNEIVFSRRLLLGADGRFLDGHDRLAGDGRTLRLKNDIPFAVHFHLHPDVNVSRGPRAKTAVIEVGTGERWQFSAEGALLAVEESIFFADSAGPRTALQIVLRGATAGESEVHWRLEREAD
jgi:uncharacterized heparinase superfamily protein